MTPACLKGGTVGGGGFPPPVSPRFPGHSSDRNAPAWPSASPPVHYTLRLDRALVPPFPGT